jgi:hypothetical protein
MATIDYPPIAQVYLRGNESYQRMERPDHNKLAFGAFSSILLHTLRASIIASTLDFT